MKKYVFALICVLALVRHVAAQAVADTSQLSKFIGKYQFTDNKMVFLLIKQIDHQLVLKQLWDNQEIPFKQTGALTFYNDEHSFPLEFKKSDKGTINQVVAFDRDTWNRVPDNYVQEMQKFISLNAGQLKPLEGKYQLKGGDGDADDMLQITASGDHLVLTQEWDHQNIDILPVSEVDFFNKNQTFPIKFIKDNGGNVIQLVAKNKDVWVKMK